MSKLSPSLKALINSSRAKPGPCAASPAIKDVYNAIKEDARRRNVGDRSWVTISAAATFTLNSPESLSLLHSVASSSQPSSSSSSSSSSSFSSSSSSSSSSSPVALAELIREVGIKCISFNGIPRTINCLNAFRDTLPEVVTSHLATTPSRAPTEQNLADTQRRGSALWDSVYRPFEAKLHGKLGLAHPDLPVVILNSHYGPALADPPLEERPPGVANLGRVGTSLVAIACLRAQTGVGPQVVSHVFGLRKGYGDGTWRDGTEGAEEEVSWLASDEGSEWVLSKVDEIVDALGGSNFAGSSKL